MIVVGGTYNEYCFEPRWELKYGSGLRACWTLNKLNPCIGNTFHTFCDSDSKRHLEHIRDEINLKLKVTTIDKSVEFRYDYPLATPNIFPRLDTLNKSKNKITIKGDSIIVYGMIEGDAKVRGKRVVYDPQSPSNPVPFSKTGSTADELAVVVNLTEAKRMIGDFNADINSIKKYFFNKEKVSVLVLKMGPKGAMVFHKRKTEIIPVYETPYVWPIGSGDVFAASFAHYWLNENKSPFEASKKASWNTACYCNSMGFHFTPFESDKNIKPIAIKDFPKGQIYLAGPFFTFAERWIVEQVYRCLTDMNMKVFSPWHEVGHGLAEDVVLLDLKGLNKSKFVFAIVDGLDSGTLFEIGYAIAKKIPVICYVQKETKENTKMMEGTHCVLEKDLTTAIYKSLWRLSKNE